MDVSEKFESWAIVEGYNNIYEVSDQGRIRRMRKHKEPKIKEAMFIGKDGYKRVYLWKNNKSKAFLIHRLVAQAFIGNIPKGLIVNHKDGIKTNNFSYNIEYTTHSGNLSHAYRIHLRRSGEQHFWSKLTEIQVREMLKLNKETGIGCRRLSKRYNVSTSTIKLILNGTNW
jgi:hypothetical protein